MPTPRSWPFIATKEHRRFVEFADTVKRDRTIGICYGSAGIGKTLSASRYTRWDKAGHLLNTWGERQKSDADIYAALSRARTVLYTPTVAAPLRQIRDDLRLLCDRVNICIEQHLHPVRQHYQPIDFVELVIVDESERLSATAVEHLRDQYDRGDHGLLFIGMTGIEKTFSRYPQLYSRVGFAHHYRPLTGEELTFVLNRQWHKLGLDLNPDDLGCR
jgi:DNA transposition AAA+ family ATPase